MRNLHKYEEFFPDEFNAEFKKSPVVYCSFGPVEQHGRHSALGVDLIKGHEICLRAAEISGGIVFPRIPFAPAGAYHKQFPRIPVKPAPCEYLLTRTEIHQSFTGETKLTSFPGVFISADVCEKLYYELLEVFAEDIGFKVCVIMGSHGPAGELAKKIAMNKPVFKGMKMIVAGSLSHNMDLVEAEYKRLGLPRISHGGMWESAMFMVSNPEYINPEKLKDAVPNASEKYWIDNYGQDAVPNYEEISKVSLEFGERLVQTAAERIAEDAMKALDEMKHADESK